MITYKCFRSLVMTHTPSTSFLPLWCSWVYSVFSWNRLSSSWIVKSFYSKWCLLYYPRWRGCLHWDSTTNDKKCGCSKGLHCKIGRKALLLEVWWLALFGLSQGQYHAETNIFRSIVCLYIVYDTQIQFGILWWRSDASSRLWNCSFILAFRSSGILCKYDLYQCSHLFVLVTRRETSVQPLEETGLPMSILYVHLVAWVLTQF